MLNIFLWNSGALCTRGPLNFVYPVYPIVTPLLSWPSRPEQDESDGDESDGDESDEDESEGDAL